MANKCLQYFALTIAVVGAINWGLIGFFNFNLIAFLFGSMSWLSRIVYGLVGLCGLYLLTFYTLIDQEKANMEIKDQAKYALYPVWILNTTWKGKKYIFAMNGQTGKIVGDLPADNGAFWRFVAMWGAGIGLVLYALLWVFMVLL